MSTNPYAPPKAPVEDALPAGERAPALWNPNAAAIWGLLLSPIFGAVLHMKNWQALGDAKKAAESRMWAIACSGFFIVLILASILFEESKALDLVSRAGGFGLLIAWYIQSARTQIRYIAGRFGTTYPRRGWGKPLLYAFLVFVAFMVVVFVLALVTGAASGEADPQG